MMSLGDRRHWQKLFHWDSEVTRSLQEALGTNWSTLSEHCEVFLHCAADSTGTGRPERLWSLLLGVLQKPPGCGFE